MNYPNEKEFTPRLEWVLADRKITPWAKKLGLSSGTAARLLSNVVPGTDILTAIMRTEHVNLNWLLEGKGTPFMLDSYTNADAFENMLSIHAQDAQYTAYLSVDMQSSMASVVLVQPATFEFKNKSIEYQQIETLYGPCRNPLALSEALKGCDIHSFSLTQLDAMAFSRGQFGTYKLLGDDKHKGLVSKSGVDLIVQDGKGVYFAEMKNKAKRDAMTVDHIVPKNFTFSINDKLEVLNMVIMCAEEHHIADKLDKATKMEVVETLEEMHKPVSQITPTEIEFALRASVH
tara:strand:+ start:3867 stop:4733 length:867 start_codon:yes stop_codon:yes gene_type:complete